MLIFQKNFNTVDVPMIQNPHLRDRVHLPTPSWQHPAYAVSSSDSHRPDIVNSSVNPEVQNPLFRDPVQTAIAKTRATETDAILAQNAHAQNESILNKQIRDHAAKEQATAAAATNNGQNLAEIQDTAIIDSTLEAEDNLPQRSVVDIAKTKATVAATNAKKNAKEALGTVKEKGKEIAGKAKNAVVEGYSKLAENYGEGLTGSLGTDAALAAGGLALAGGAYRLLKKRRERKRAEKKALSSKVKR